MNAYRKTFLQVSGPCLPANRKLNPELHSSAISKPPKITAGNCWRLAHAPLATTFFCVGLTLMIISPAPIPSAPVPHHFDGITFNSDRMPKLTLGGSVLGMFTNLPTAISNQFMQMFDLYPLDVSSNLTDWTSFAIPARTNNNSSPLVVVDTNAPDSLQRFYRTYTNQLPTAFRKPSGPFAVGITDRVMMDPTRTNRYRYSPPTNTFMVTFWYPAAPPPAGLLPVPMWDKRLAEDRSLYSAANADPNWALVNPLLLSHAFPQVSFPAGSAKYPIILWSVGVPFWRKGISQGAAELASHGYVVVAMDHCDCWGTVFPDGRYLAGNRVGELPNRFKDMQFLLDILPVLNAGDALMAGHLDLDRIGVSGGSYGGMVVETCRTNTRVKCAALYDATNVQLNPAGLQKPFLVVLGQTNSFYAEDWWLFNRAITNAVFLQLRGADHMTTSDVAWAGEVPWGRGPATAYNDCQVWFFDTYLKGETPEFPANSEIYNLHRK